MEKKKVTTVNYQSNLNTKLSLEKKEGKKNGIDYNSNVSNQNNLNGNLKNEENIVYRSGKDNLAFRMD